MLRLNLRKNTFGGKTTQNVIQMVLLLILYAKCCLVLLTDQLDEKLVGVKVVLLLLALMLTGDL